LNQARFTQAARSELLVVFNQKGGVGKSTITCNLAAISAQQGLRTLVIDLDPQGNSTRYLLGDRGRRGPRHGRRVLRPDLEVHAAQPGDGGVHHRHAVRAPGCAALQPQAGRAARKLESRYKIYKLRDALDALGDRYDRIYIDTPPALNFYTRSALIAARGA
jgi:chromosome partitioning protein